MCISLFFCLSTFTKCNGKYVKDNQVQYVTVELGYNVLQWTEYFVLL